MLLPDMQAIYMKSVRSPVHPGGARGGRFRLQHNQAPINVYSQLPRHQEEESQYQEDSFCVGSEEGLLSACTSCVCCVHVCVHVLVHACECGCVYECMHAIQLCQDWNDVLFLTQSCKSFLTHMKNASLHNDQCWASQPDDCPVWQTLLVGFPWTLSTATNECAGIDHQPSQNPRL